MTDIEYPADLRTTVRAALDVLTDWDDQRAAGPVAPGKWSPKQIIGHLIDSANNNHGRFVRAGLGAPLRFEGYQQEQWVEAQGYAAADWASLLGLWSAYNLHLADVMERIPFEVRARETTDHNLHRMAWEIVPEGQPTTLDYFMRDYVNHLKHHLRQIDDALCAPPVMQSRDSSIKRT